MQTKSNNNVLFPNNFAGYPTLQMKYSNLMNGGNKGGIQIG